MGDMLPRPEPREAFRRALRARLMAEAAVALGQRETTWARFQRSWLRPALAVGLAALVLVVGAGTAAADSLPGDLTFGLKRAAEELQLTLALDDTTRLRILADQADHRLSELSQAAATRPAAAPTATTEYTAAVERLTAAVEALRGRPDASEDKRIEAEDVANAARAKHTAVLDQLEKDATPETKDDIDRARDEADHLRPSDRPARSPDASERPDRSRSPEPNRTATPTRSPEPTRSPDRDGSRGTATPTPTVRR